MIRRAGHDGGEVQRVQHSRRERRNWGQSRLQTCEVNIIDRAVQRGREGKDVFGTLIK